jgi:hypothetical protein
MRRTWRTDGGVLVRAGEESELGGALTTLEWPQLGGRVGEGDGAVTLLMDLLLSLTLSDTYMD